MSEVNKVNEDIVTAKIALLEYKILKEISEKQKKEFIRFAGAVNKQAKIYLDALASEGINSTAIKGFLEKARDKQFEYLEKIQSDSLKPKDEPKIIDGLKRLQRIFVGFHNVIKDISEAGASIRDYEDILEKELEDSKTAGRPSKKMTELFPNDYKKFSTALTSSFNTEIKPLKPEELEISFDIGNLVGEFVNMPIKSLNAFASKIQKSEPPAPPSPPGSPPSPATPDAKIKDIFKGANEQNINKFNEKFKEKFGFELSDHDDIAAIIAAMA